MKGQTAAATQAAEGQPGLAGEPASAGGPTSPAVPHECSDDCGGYSPPEMFTQKGVEGNWFVFITRVFSLDFQTLGMSGWLPSVPMEERRDVSLGCHGPCPTGSPFSTEHHRAERERESAGNNACTLSKVMCDADKSKCIWQIWNDMDGQYLHWKPLN